MELGAVVELGPLVDRMEVASRMVLGRLVLGLEHGTLALVHNGMIVVHIAVVVEHIVVVVVLVASVVHVASVAHIVVVVVLVAIVASVVLRMLHLQIALESLVVVPSYLAWH